MSTDPSNDILSGLYADIHAGLARMVRETDETPRRTLAGRRTEDVREAAEAAFADLGLHLSDEQLDDYANCLVTGRPFTFVLG